MIPVPWAADVEVCLISVLGVLKGDADREKERENGLDGK
jgi:hypothetical protein